MKKWVGNNLSYTAVFKLCGSTYMCFFFFSKQTWIKNTVFLGCETSRYGGLTFPTRLIVGLEYVWIWLET